MKCQTLYPFDARDEKAMEKTSNYWINCLAPIKNNRKEWFRTVVNVMSKVLTKTFAKIFITQFEIQTQTSINAQKIVKNH